MFLVLLLLTLATAVGAMLTALPWLEMRLDGEPVVPPAKAPTGN